MNCYSNTENNVQRSYKCSHQLENVSVFTRSLRHFALKLSTILHLHIPFSHHISKILCGEYQWLTSRWINASLYVQWTPIMPPYTLTAWLWFCTPKLQPVVFLSCIILAYLLIFYHQRCQFEFVTMWNITLAHRNCAKLNIFWNDFWLFGSRIFLHTAIEFRSQGMWMQRFSIVLMQSSANVWILLSAKLRCRSIRPLLSYWNKTNRQVPFLRCNFIRDFIPDKRLLSFFSYSITYMQFVIVCMRQSTITIRLTCSK